MKKHIAAMVALVLAGILGGCDDGDTAQLWVYNDIDASVVGLYLSGASETSDLLKEAEVVSFVDGGWIEDGPLSDAGLGRESIVAVTGIKPGTYTWRVVFPANQSPIDGVAVPEYRGVQEFTVYPGRNNLVLKMSKAK
ncbi:MAG: hypothetical protein PHU25_05075 [Deltaproteobacteria bacterium]|nr:hypothetical protein [Deltaproteobacteria bacterium]